MKRGDVDTKFQRLTLAYADQKNQVQIGNFKVDTYDKVKKYVKLCNSIKKCFPVIILFL